MRAILLATIPLSLALAILPLAQGAAPCAAANAGGADQPFYVYQPIGRVFEVWEETNGAPGLQRDRCTDGAGVEHPVDTFVTKVEVPRPPCFDLGFGLVCVVP